MVVKYEQPTRTPSLASQVDEWPYEIFPTGWFQIGWLDEMELGAVEPVRFFGTDLVKFRTMTGTVHVLDAYCGHLGAHLGHGGWVDGECVVCPFHGWQWDGEGVNRMVPSVGESVDRRRQRAWPVRVTNGILWLWHDAFGRAPFWEPHLTQPEYENEEYYPLVPHCVKSFPGIGGRPQYMAENNADMDHLRWVHGAEGPVQVARQVEDGPYLYTDVSITYGYGKRSTKLTPNGPVETTMQSVTQSVGAVMVRYPLDGTVLFSCSTPVDDQVTDIYQTVLVRRTPGDAGDKPTGLAHARVKEQFVQVTRDFTIWENQHYIKKSPLTRDEAEHMGRLRKWARQFYQETP